MSIRIFNFQTLRSIKSLEHDVIEQKLKEDNNTPNQNNGTPEVKDECAPADTGLSNHILLWENYDFSLLPKPKPF